MNAGILYQEAYDEQYRRKNYVAACKKYIMVIERFPGSAESDSAQIQLDEMEKSSAWSSQIHHRKGQSVWN